MTAMSKFEPVGVMEISKRLGVKRDTVDKWQRRGVMPKPTGTVSGYPAWQWARIEAWARQTGRLRDAG